MLIKLEPSPIKKSGITNDFVDPSNSIIYGKEPRYSEQILPVPWHFIISRFHQVMIRFMIAFTSTNLDTWQKYWKFIQ